MAEYYFHIFFIHSYIAGHLGCVHIMAIVKLLPFITKKNTSNASQWLSFHLSFFVIDMIPGRRENLNLMICGNSPPSSEIIQFTGYLGLSLSFLFVLPSHGHFPEKKLSH